MPDRFAKLGDPWRGMDEAAGSLEPLLSLAEQDEAAGMPDAPRPPHYDKQAGEAPRVQPLKRRTAARGRRSQRRVRRRSQPQSLRSQIQPTGRRRSTMPLIEVARAASKDEALAGLDRWKERHATAWP